MKYCPIEIRSGCFDDLDVSSYSSRIVIITDKHVASLYGNKLALRLKADLFSFSAGETYKTRATKESLENQLLEKGIGRDTCIIGLGGGVVTDVAGYLAATYCRGLPYIPIPTTLLGMVDASIGGKTGVNTPYGKNMIGCIYQPKKIFMDPLLLKTLPQNEFSNGIVEMIKHGVIHDASYFNFLEGHKIVTLDLQKAIFESCRIKKQIVEEDENEKGKRHLLNFGHTIGHALELFFEYQLSHGEAVAIGMLVEAYMAVSLGILSQSAFNRIYAILMHYKLPLKLPTSVSPQRMMDQMILDKKSLKGKPRFVMIRDIGFPHDCMSVDAVVIKQALDWMNDAFSCH